MKSVKKAVVLAAGFGTRFLPATKASPKEMLPIVDTPAIQLAIEEAVHSGITEFIIVTGRGKRAIEDHFDKSYELEELLKSKGKLEALAKVQDTYKNIQIAYVRQTEMKGTGDAVMCARNLIGDEPFAVILPDDLIMGDVPCLRQLLDVYEEHGCSVTAAMKVNMNEVSSYGILSGTPVGDRLYDASDVVEKPKQEDAPSRYAVIGRHIFTPAIFDILEKQGPGNGGEIVLTESMKTLMKKEKVYGFLFDGVRFDTGSPLGFVKATVYAALQRPDMKEDLKAFVSSLISG